MDAGLVFAWTPFIYSTTALLVQPLSDRWGHKPVIALGLLLVGLAYLGLGPMPLPPFAAAVGSGDERQGAYACVSLCVCVYV